MESSSASISSFKTTDRLYAPNPASKLKTYVCAIAIIVGIGGLVVGGVGIAVYFGAISNLNQVHAIIMMAAGAGSGAILFFGGIVGTVKNRQKHTLQDDSHTRYGADVWGILGVTVLDEVPQAPEVDWDKDDPYFHEPYRDNFVLLYIPQRVQVGGEEKKLTLQTLRGISESPFREFSQDASAQFDDSTSHGWVLVSKKVIPDSLGKDYDTQKNMVEEQKGFRMPQTLEAIAANLIISACTKEPLFGTSSFYTRCIEKINSYPVVVGGCDSGFNVILSIFDCNIMGVAALWKF